MLQTFVMLVDVRSIFKEWDSNLVLAQSESFVQLFFPFLILFFEHLKLEIIEIADNFPYFGSQIDTFRFSRVFLGNLFDTQTLSFFRFGFFFRF